MRPQSVPFAVFSPLKATDYIVATTPVRVNDFSVLTRDIFCRYNVGMKQTKNKRGRPRGATGRAKANVMQVRLEAAEKAAFAAAAVLDGKDLSEWVRDRLRRASRQELEAAGQPVAFLVSRGSA